MIGIQPGLWGKRRGDFVGKTNLKVEWLWAMVGKKGFGAKIKITERGHPALLLIRLSHHLLYQHPL